MITVPSKALIEAIRKIPILNALSPSQARQVLSICTRKSYQPGEIVCTSTTSSEEMYVLISGELEVVLPEGIRVTTLTPVSTVGEMGVITKQPRSATIRATQQSQLLVIPRTRFDYLLREDAEMQARVYRNIVDILSARLLNDNIRTRDYHMEKRRYEDRITVLERRLEEQIRKTEITLNLLAQKGLAREEAERHIAAQMKDAMLRVLIVEDEPEVRRWVKQALSSCEVVEAGNGREALAVMVKERLDLVITDIKMPEMDGFTLLSNVRFQYPTLPVLALSGYVGPEEIQRYGFNGFIPKPIKLEEFRKVVETALAKDKAG